MHGLRRITAAVGCSALAATAVGCGGSGGHAADPPSASHPATTAARVPSPFTGRPARPDARVLAVKLDDGVDDPDDPSSKPFGLDRADVVYVAGLDIAQHSLAQVLGIFTGPLPRSVGNVSYVQPTDLQMLRQYGRPAFAHAEVQRRAKPVRALLADEPVIDVSAARARAAYQANPEAPDPAKLLRAAPRASHPRDIGFRFGPAPAGGKSRDAVTVRYPRGRIGFRWSAERGEWLSWIGKQPNVTVAGAQLGAPTVVIQRGPIRRRHFVDGTERLFSTVGHGRGTVLRDGRAYPVHWSRPDAASGTTYTTGGTRMTFHRGPVWVVLAPA